MKSGGINAIQIGNTVFPVDKSKSINWEDCPTIDELNLKGSTGEVDLIETKTSRKFKITYTVTSSEYLKENEG